MNVNGNNYVIGTTQSATYPVSLGAYDETINGNYDVFVTVVNSMGTDLIYSIFIGGNDYDVGYSLALDSNENVYLTGITKSSNFPTTTGAIDTTYNGNGDVFVLKLNPTGSSLLLSTFIGDAGEESGSSIAIDDDENIYVVGYTMSNAFPVTSGVYDITYNGGTDVFVLKLNSNGNSLLFSTFLRGSNNESPISIKLDVNGDVYLAGCTESSDFPVTTGAYDQIYNGNLDVFVTRINSTGSGLVFSTYIGESDYETFANYHGGMALDNNGNVYVAGQTSSTDFPVTTGAYDITHNGSSDAYVFKLNSTVNSLLYSTFIGGNWKDFASSIVVDTDGSAYVIGSTWSSDFR